MHRALQGHEGGVIDRLGNARSHWRSLCIGLSLGAESKQCGEWANCDGPYKDPSRAKQSAEHSVSSLPSRSSYCLIIRLSEHQSVAATTVAGDTVVGNLQENNNTGATPSAMAD